MAAEEPSKKKARSKDEEELSYNTGFNNEFATEALPGALPVGQNNPQKCPYGLYAEQLSGTAFTKPRHTNKRTWFYRIRPSVLHSKYIKIDNGNINSSWSDAIVDPNQLRWAPEPLIPSSTKKIDFIQGLNTMAGNGDPVSKSGCAIHMYNCNTSMMNKCFSNADGDFLIVPELGTLNIQTEHGDLKIENSDICVIPRGIKFSVNVEQSSRGYVFELYEGHFELPGLGPIGSNGLANARDFEYPKAKFEDRECLDNTSSNNDDDNGGFHIINKFGGELFLAKMKYSPYNVVAWHGNYSPYKYDLKKFCCMNSVTYDHPDPSIYTVLTAASADVGTAVCDFVIFPPRWMVMENSFRPPWYHRNTMTEFMGMIYGKYDAKEGFMAGGASLHSCMTAHGPDGPTFDKASTEKLEPVKFDAGLAFMFETSAILKLTKHAINSPQLEQDYLKCWEGCTKKFNGKI
jgi:homogentisate 1,2-dioxygenase